MQQTINFEHHFHFQEITLRETFRLEEHYVIQEIFKTLSPRGVYMSGVNKVIIVGRLGADPEIRTVSENNTVARLSVATSESWNDRNGQKQERTEWHRVVVWGKLADLCGKYLAKGRQVYVEGRLQTRSWEDQQGQKKFTTEVVANTVQFLGGQTNASANNSDDFPTQNFGPEPSFDSEEEIPF